MAKSTACHGSEASFRGEPVIIFALVAWVALISVVGVALFWWDKNCAVHDRRRVPERTLLSVAALGAGPLMLWSTTTLRHKTRKQPFRAYLITIVAIQALLLVAVLVGMLLWH